LANMHFIHEGKWVFWSQSTCGYHKEMTTHTFRDWFLYRFINYLEGSIIIMGNASYHLVTLNKVPNNSSRKQDISEWLQHREIYFPPTGTKSELLQ
jgi:hypothetical protein